MVAVSGTSTLLKLIGCIGLGMSQLGTFLRFLTLHIVIWFNQCQTALTPRQCLVKDLPSSCSPWCRATSQVLAIWQGLLGMTIALWLAKLSADLAGNARL